VLLSQQKYIRPKLRVVGADETSFAQGNVDGCNDKKSQGWLGSGYLISNLFSDALPVVRILASWVKTLAVF